MTPGENHPPAPETTQTAKSDGAFGRFFKDTETVLLLLLAIFGLSVAWSNSASDAGVDFYQFWVVGQSASHFSINNIYSDEARERLGGEFLEKAKSAEDLNQVKIAKYRQKLETYSSPFLYALFGRFSTGDFEVDFRNYRLLMLAGLIFGIGMLCRLLNHSWGTALGAIAICSAWFEPFESDMRVGNVNSLQFAALAAYLWVVMRMRRCHRDVVGGALLGLAVAFKPNLVPVAGVLAVHWVASRQARRLWSHSLGAAAGAVAAILFAAAGFRNFHCWTDWLSALHSMPGGIITVDLGNFSPAQFLNESSGLNTAIPLAILFGGLTIAVLWSRQRNAAREVGTPPVAEEFPEIFAVSIGCLLVVLTAPLAWLHYYVLTIPAFLFLLRPAGASQPGIGFVLRPLLSVVALVILAVIPIVYFGIPLSTRAQGVLAVCAALTLFFLLAVFPHPGKAMATDSTNG